ncbi:hypothetical protein LA080_004189 [Diaporthe eres]|nr:hypothetical protein LA080_004189 [Diaporthe eres]
MTSFTPLSFPTVGLASQNGQFGEDVLMSVRRFSSFVSNTWRAAVRDSGHGKSMMRRLSKIVSREEENEDASSAEPSPLERTWAQPASPDSGLRHRRFSLSPSVSVAEIRIMSPGSHPDE